MIEKITIGFAGLMGLLGIGGQPVDDFRTAIASMMLVFSKIECLILACRGKGQKQLPVSGFMPFGTPPEKLI